jgi:hypothetical protein
MKKINSTKIILEKKIDKKICGKTLSKKKSCGEML